eukprot:774378-Rhodomonas_salina.2
MVHASLGAGPGARACSRPGTPLRSQPRSPGPQLPRPLRSVSYKAGRQRVARPAAIVELSTAIVGLLVAILGAVWDRDGRAARGGEGQDGTADPGNSIVPRQCQRYMLLRVQLGIGAYTSVPGGIYYYAYHVSTRGVCCYAYSWARAVPGGVGAAAFDVGPLRVLTHSHLRGLTLSQ